MPLTEADIAKVAQLAHLELAEEELKTLGSQIAEVVAYIEQLNELDTTNVEPAIGGLTPEGEQTSTSRADEIEGSLGQKTALAEAPDPASGHFRVPKVL
ncbi:MAG TPA: Asp-tRNA(Asn)/Glu-tRNA(Gln) amidotransferase subunit GatC [Pyrinomonadaceae bacterium]|jgi:aspartyl-tRNA(Asn)/glutamyl-tRNA(Gln) amidotransferase subunit C|nr:Asp-tRNA(Asn)/Glu-tRNA(Gln) amidotransferase subunit GatC [Pyrinomonadaceae bacterium]